MRRTLDSITRLVTALRRRQRYVPSGHGPVKVNLGSGLTVAEGWVNIDSSIAAAASTLPAPALWVAYRLSTARRWYSFAEFRQTLRGSTFVHHDLAYGIPLPDATADFIYSGHLLELLDRAESEALMRDAARVLKPNGVLRINVPDLSPALAAFARGDTEAGLAMIIRAEEGWYSRRRHKYDLGMLERLLTQAGFSAVARRSKREGTLPDLDRLEIHSPDGLYVEATLDGVYPHQSDQWVKDIPAISRNLPASSRRKSASRA